MSNVIGIRIKKLRESKKIPRKALADFIGVHETTIKRYEDGDTKKLPTDRLENIAKYLGSSIEYLMGWIDEAESTSTIDKKMQDKFSKLNKDNKQKAYNYTSNLLENQTKEIRELEKVYVTEKVAAGVGYSYGDNESVPYYTDRTDLPSYDFATLVSGDSMIPDYEDGDVILLRQGYDSVNGDVYVIDYDGKSYVKKLYNDGTRFVLKSINEKYDDIVIYLSDTEDTYFNIVGKVIDSFKPKK